MQNARRWEERSWAVKVNPVNGVDNNLVEIKGFSKNCAVKIKVRGEWREGTLLGCNARLDAGMHAFVALDNGEVYRDLVPKIRRVN